MCSLIMNLNFEIFEYLDTKKENICNPLFSRVSLEKEEEWKEKRKEGKEKEEGKGFDS